MSVATEETVLNDLAELDAVLASMTNDEPEETITDELEELDILIEESAVNEALDVGAEETIVSQNEDVAEGDLQALEQQIQRDEIYAAQESSETPEEIKGENEKKPRPQGGVSSSTATSAGRSASRAVRDLSSVSPEHFVLTGDASSMTDEDLATNKAQVIGLRPAQVKVAEKFDNIFTAKASGRAPSKYTMIAFSLLEKNGTVTGTEITAAFTASGLADGTARSQSGQMMALLPAIGVADRNMKSLTLRSDSNIAAYLKGHI